MLAPAEPQEVTTTTMQTHMRTRELPTSLHLASGSDWLLLAGATGALGFVGVALVEGATRPGYDAWTHYVSELSLSSYGWMQIANFIVCGLLIVAGAIGLRQHVGRGLGAGVGSGLIGLFGLGLVAAGLFVMDPTHGYPADVASQGPPTWHGALHGLAGLICFTSLGTAALVLARRLSGGWTGYSFLTGLIVLGGFVGSLASDVLGKLGALPDAPTGLIQRIAIVAGWTWLALLLLHVRAQSHPEP